MFSYKAELRGTAVDIETVLLNQLLIKLNGQEQLMLIEQDVFYRNSC